MILSKDIILDQAAAGRPLSKALELLSHVAPNDQGSKVKNLWEHCYAIEKGEDTEPCSVDPAELLYIISLVLCAEHGSGILDAEVVNSFTVLSEVCKSALEHDRDDSIIAAVERYFKFLGGPHFPDEVYDMLDAALSSDLMNDPTDRQMAFSICRGLVDLHDAYSRSSPGKSLGAHQGV